MFRGCRHRAYGSKIWWMDWASGLRAREVLCVTDVPILYGFTSVLPYAVPATPRKSRLRVDVVRQAYRLS